MVIDDARPEKLVSSKIRTALIGGAAVALALLVGLQIYASAEGFTGPLHSLASDYVATPKSASVPWAALALALVGLNNRRRLVVFGLAAGIDAVFLIERLIRGGAVTVGNGPTIVLTGLVLVAAFRWWGIERRTALHAAALGWLLILATKVGDAWLQITALSRPVVLDQYAELADRALGNPSWYLGRAIDWLGPVVYNVLHWVYIELPVAAMVVAVWQLRHVVRDRVWPKHYLVRTFLVLGLVGPIIYVFFPVVGPIFAYQDFWPNVVPAVDVTPTGLPFDDFTPRNCMPSMHTAWALTVFIHSRQGPRWLRWGGTFWLVCTLTATLGFGYHYGVDLVAGAVLCLTVESALRDPERGWGLWRIRLVVGGAVALLGLLASYRFLAVQMAEYRELFGLLVLGTLALMAVAFHRTFFRESRVPPTPVDGGGGSLVRS